MKTQTISLKEIYQFAFAHPKKRITLYSASKCLIALTFKQKYKKEPYLMIPSIDDAIPVENIKDNTIVHSSKTFDKLFAFFTNNVRYSSKPYMTGKAICEKICEISKKSHAHFMS